MPKQVIADVFETLGGVVRSTGQQAVADAKKITEEAAVELGLSAQAQGSTDDAQKQDQAKEEEINKMKATERQKTAAGYRKITEEIRQIQLEKKREIPKEVSGKPGFDESKVVRQIETGPSFANLPAGKAGATEGKEEDKKKLPPVNVQRERTKAERFRGVSG